MILTDDEKRMLNGEFGVGIQKCMKLLVQWGALFGAEKMAHVSNVRLVIGISNTTYALAKESGYMDPIERAGAMITNTCRFKIEEPEE